MSLKKADKRIGFVPTMGALHPGHLSLLQRAKKENDIAVTSIFVNPLQFNDKRDLENYPRSLEKDVEMLKSAGCEILFAPSSGEMYPASPPTPLFEEKGVDLGALDKVMEGLYRPGHFQGVCVVVKKLFDIVKPDRAYFGEKDFQQLVIIKHMVKTLKMRVRIVSCPTVREFDGLAMSSRNVFLTTEERKNVLMIPRTLLRLKTNKQKTSVKELKKWVTDGMINYPFLDMEYFEIVNSETLLPVQDWKEAKKLRACMAVKVGSVRLIDNVPI